MRRIASGLLGVAILVGGCLIVRSIGRDVPADEPAVRDAPVVAPAAGEPDTKRGAVKASKGPGAIRGVVLRGGVAVAARIEVRKSSSPEQRSTGVGLFRLRNLLRVTGKDFVPGSLVASVQGAEDGSFEVGDLPSRSYHVTAVGADGARVSLVLELDESTPIRDVTLALPLGECRLTGRVVDANGVGVRAQVAAFSGPVETIFGGDAALDSASWQSTRDGGAFTIGGLPPGELRVLAVVPGVRLSVSPPVRLPRTEPLVFQLSGDAGALKGRVVEAVGGAPISAASVVALATGESPGDATHVLQAWTGEDGSFSLPTATAGMLIAEADGFAPAWTQRPVSGTDVLLELSRTGRIDGRVLRAADDAPQAGVTVHARGTGERFGIAAPARAVSLADGSFVLTGVPPGEVTVHALGGGWVSEGLASMTADGFNPLSVTLEPDRQATVELRVERSGTIDVLVVDAALSPIPGADVTPHVGRRDMFGGPTTRMTDAQGRATFSDLVPRVPYSFDVSHSGFSPKRAPRVSAAAEEPPSVTVQLDLARFVLVRVVSARTGTPVADAELRVHGGPGETRGATDEAGECRLGPVPAGAQSFEVSAAGYQDRESVPMPAGPGDEPLLVQLEPGLSIAGRVVAPAGVLLRRTTVALAWDFDRMMQADFDPSEVDLVSLRHRQVRCDGEGRFRFDSLPAGHFELSASSSWQGRRFAGKAKAVTGSDDVTIELVAERAARDGSLVVHVTGPDGAIVPRADIELIVRSESLRGSHGTSLRDGEARFDFEPRKGARQWVRVRRPRSSSERPLPLAGTIVEVSHHSETELTISLAAGQSIEGRLIDGDENGVRGVVVHAHLSHPVIDDKELDRRSSWGQGRSGADGAFRIDRLGAGDYFLVVEAPSTFAPVPPTPVAAGATNAIIALRTGAHARITALDDQGRPVERATVYARHPDGGFVHGTTDAKGVAELAGMEPNALYALEIQPPHDRQHEFFRFREENWPPRERTAQLERAWWIEGVVHGADGRPAPKAMVLQRHEDGSGWRGNSADEKGRFRITGLRSGDVLKLAVEPPDDFSAPPASEGPFGKKEWVDVRAGEHDVILTIPRH